eukprot:GHVU01007034.1.p1 GENE.GHVU01007034.1~~GHVU01007034.1.p1  ORF type:complete len:170 (-),score=11.76 GHVU01007034.1:671-1180(-)
MSRKVRSRPRNRFWLHFNPITNSNQVIGRLVLLLSLLLPSHGCLRVRPAVAAAETAAVRHIFVLQFGSAAVRRGAASSPASFSQSPPALLFCSPLRENDRFPHFPDRRAVKLRTPKVVAETGGGDMHDDATKCDPTPLSATWEVETMKFGAAARHEAIAGCATLRRFYG